MSTATSNDGPARIREQISALLDGEISDQEMPLLMKRLEQDAELRDYWHRQSRMRDALRGASVTDVRKDFTASVMDAIDNSPVESLGNENFDLPKTSKVVRTPAWLKPVAGFAVAASVAGMAVLGLNTLQSGTDGNGGGGAGQVAFFESATQSAGVKQASPVWLDQTRVEPFSDGFALAERNGKSSVSTVDYKAKRDHRLNSYLSQHHDQVWLLGQSGEPEHQARGYQSPAERNIFDTYYARPAQLGERLFEVE